MDMRLFSVLKILRILSRESLDYVPHDVFASCKVWFKVVGTRLWTNPWELQSWKEPQKVLFLSPYIQGGKSAHDLRRVVVDLVFMTHPRVGVLIVPKWLFERKALNSLVFYYILELKKCEQWLGEIASPFFGWLMVWGVCLWHFKIWKIFLCPYHSYV